MARKNLPVSNVATAPSPATTGTTLSVTAGEETRFKAVPFYVTAFPSGQLPTPANAEIVQVTAIDATTKVFTLVRAQRGPGAKAIAVGWVIYEGIYGEDLDTIEQNIADAQAAANTAQTTANSKADDTAVVHNTGNETVGGIKTFSSSVVLPGDPTAALQAAPKQYIDGRTPKITVSTTAPTTPATNDLWVDTN